MKIIFWGSDDFALAHLEKIYASTSNSVVACVTQPDKPKGRGLHLVASPIKEFAIAHQIPILQPDTLKNADFVSILKNYSADLFVVIAYGKILPAEILSIPKKMAINVHGSLLPKYRGAAPINWAIINGEKQTGLTIIQMSPFLDAGDILAQENIRVEDEETSISLRRKMMTVGPEFLFKMIADIEKGNLSKPIKQDGSVTQAPKLTKELGRIDWKRSASDIQRLVRGLLPWPAAYTTIHGKLIKILEAKIVDENNSVEPGTIVSIEKNAFVISTGKGGLSVLKVHLESAKPMDASQFIAGHRLNVGEKLE